MTNERSPATRDAEETRDFWNDIAADWEIQVGDDGDRNRMLNSDPVLWDFAGEAAGLIVLDAGCGTGYLSRKLAARGAQVIGVDHSEKMIEIARQKAPDVDFRVDSCSDLSTIGDGVVDLLLANYVLMDTPDFEAAIRAFHRVLKSGGVAVLVFSHPCFPAARSIVAADRSAFDYRWTFPYFEQRRCVDPPWNHFTSDFIWFHRPLSDYWKAFRRAGFEVVDFDEPRLSVARRHLAADQSEFDKSQWRPFSVAFKLVKAVAA